jgi:DNA adenine methylase
MEPLEPFKFPGCKAKLAPVLVEHVGKVAGTYREPFAGSACLFHHLVDRGLIRAAVLSDADEVVVRAHRELSNPDALARLTTHREAKWTQARFNQTRARVNAGTLKGWAGDFIALQGAVFNGVFRRNRDGVLNTPWNHKPRASIPSVERMAGVVRRMEIAEVLHQPAIKAIDGAKAGDVVYLDPPYVGDDVWSAYGSARAYTLQDLAAVIEASERAADRGVRVVLSHSVSADVQALLGRWTVHRVETPDRLSPKAETRGVRAEIVAVLG